MIDDLFTRFCVLVGLVAIVGSILGFLYVIYMNWASIHLWIMELSMRLFG